MKLLLALLAASMAWAADARSTVPEAVELYARHLAAVKKGPGRVSLEPLFEEGVAAARDLEHGGKLEQFDDATYRQIQSLMAGFAVGREEIVVAEPLARFFANLAAEKGTAVDQAFFQTLQKTYPDAIWAAYQNPVTDSSACTIFDGRTITGLYGAWLEFEKSYPGRYRRPSRKERTALDQAATSTCACGGQAAVIQELEVFSAAYPHAPIADQVALRLRAIKGGASGMRFFCRPG